MTTLTIQILADRRAEAAVAIEKLIKRAAKLGQAIAYSIGEPYVETREITVEDGRPIRRKVQVCDVQVTGDAPRVGPYEFLARLDFAPGGIMINSVPFAGAVDERFRAAVNVCQHCNKKRLRSALYVVRNTETGEQLQVGHNCLRDFTGIDNPAKIVARFSLYASLRELSEFGEGGGRSFHAELRELLATAATCIRLFGWLSKSAAVEGSKPTASLVNMALMPIALTKGEAETRRQILDGHTADDDRMAAETIAWARSLEGKSDYEHNLTVACASDDVFDPRQIGLIVSAVAAYQRHMGKLAERAREREANTVSTAQGAIGQRLRNLRLTQTMARVIGGDEYGECVLIKFRDEAGNIFTWITGRGTGAENGAAIVVTGTVKRHKEYNGAIETQLTRCAISQ